jgi:uncharacterized repeat protein (TIGR01451 family)
MSSPSKKSASWLARIGLSFRPRRRGQSLREGRRGLRFESLETRSMLSATVLPTISGTVYEDPTGAGVIADDYPLANVTLKLWRDGGDGIFEGSAAGSDDTLVDTTTTTANGTYSFGDLTAGTYFVQQLPVPGLSLSTNQSVQEAVITSSSLEGQTGTTIDSFSATSQYVSASAHGGKTATSSMSAPEAVGGHRNLYAQLTSSGGEVSLGADSDFTGLLDFGSNSASTGNLLVNWDGDNSNPAMLNPTGLGGIDLTSQGASTGIELNVADDRPGADVTLKVYTDANDWSSAIVPVTETSDGSLNMSDSQFIPFSSFAAGGGSGANFADVGAIQLAVSGAATSDGQMGPIQAVGPMVFNENFVNDADADLSIVKTASPSPVTAGNQLTYTFTTENNGPAGATGVTVSDPLPSSVQFVSATSSQGTVANDDGTVTVDLGSLGSGATATTTVVTTVDPGATGSITNTATVSGDQPDPNLSNNTSTVTTPVIQSADLALVKTATPNPVTAGNQLTYTLTTTNDGPSSATGVSIVDPLPAGVYYYSASGQQSATISNTTLTLNVGNLAVGGSSTINVVVVVRTTTTGTVTNTATVSGNQPDPNLANNTASVSTQVNAPVQAQVFTNLKIVKTAQPNPVMVGGSLTYTLTVTNESLATATDVTIVDTLPTGFAYFTASGQNSATIMGNTLTLNLGTLAGGGQDVITIGGEVTAAAAASIANTATVSADQPDSDPSDNTSTVITTVDRPTVPSKYNYLGR